MGMTKRGRGNEPQEAKRKREIKGMRGELWKELKWGMSPVL